MEFPRLLGTIFSLIGGGAGPLIYYGKSLVKPLKNREFDWTFGWEGKEYKYEHKNKYLYQGIDLTTICEDSLKQLDPIYKFIFASRENQTNGHIKNETNAAEGIVGLMKLKVKSGGYSPKWESGKAMFGDKLNGVKLIVAKTEDSAHYIAVVEEGNIKRGSSGGIESNLDTADWNEITKSETKKVLKEKVTKLEIKREVNKRLKRAKWGKCEVGGELKDVYGTFGDLSVNGKRYKVLDVASFGKHKWEKIGGGNIRGTSWYNHRWGIKGDETESQVLIIDMNKAVITPEGIGDRSGIDLKWGPVLKVTISKELQR